MKVGIVAPPWLAVPPPQYGGTESVVDRLARGFQDAAHDVRLFATGDSTCLVDTGWTYRVGQMDRLGQGIVELRHVADAYEWLADCDVVHDHTILGPLLAAGRNGSPPVVTTVHGAFDDDLEAVYRTLARSATVVGISEAQRASVPAVPISRVIHHGIDVEEVPFGHGDGGYLLFLGRMSPDKGPHRAIDVAGRAGLPVVLAGKCREPAEQQYFAEEVAPRLGPGVEWVDEVDLARKQQLMAGATALLNPIRWNEPFGLVMIEAMAAGTPVLAFAEGAAPEIVSVGVSGFLCTDEAQMVAAVTEAAALDRDACRAYVSNRFSTRRMITEYLMLFEDVVAGGTSFGAVAS